MVGRQDPLEGTTGRGVVETTRRSNHARGRMGSEDSLWARSFHEGWEERHHGLDARLGSLVSGGDSGAWKEARRCASHSPSGRSPSSQRRRVSNVGRYVGR